MKKRYRCINPLSLTDIEAYAYNKYETEVEPGLEFDIQARHENSVILAGDKNNQIQVNYDQLEEHFIEIKN